MNCVSVRYRTVPVVLVLTCILQCTGTVENCFKLRQLLENKVFYPQVRCGGQKIISPSGTGAIFADSPFPAKEGGGGGG